MTLEIKTSTIEPVRHTYAYTERRFGNKPATRYQEVSFDVQATTNFHYRPLWKPEKTLNDPTHTAVSLEDWYVLKDPRQFYYGAYVQNRAKMQETAENNFAFFEKRGLVENLSETVKEKIIEALLPFRYMEQTANLHMMSGCAYGYGTTITQACIFAAMDRLGMAQYISRIGFMIDGGTASSLEAAKSVWLGHEGWQGLRRLCEESLCEDDWFKLFVLQNLVIDSVMTTLVYGEFDRWLLEHEARDVAMLTEFMVDCLADLRKWSDTVFKAVASESEENRLLMQSWLDEWLERAIPAFAQWSILALGEDKTSEAVAFITERAKKLKISA